MSTDNTYGHSDSTTPVSGTSQTGTATGRSAEYDDGATGNSMQGTTGGTQNSSFGEQRRDYAADASPLGDTTGGRDNSEDVTRDETGKLISADKVQGTAVYDASGERLGTIDSIMIDKVSGKVAYAVMSFGGFLGIGERYHPLPWNVLTYDESKGGYNVAQTADQLRGGPTFGREEAGSYDYGSHGREIDDYYGVNTRRGAIGLDAGDAVGNTTGAGSSGMAATAMGANRNL